MHLQALISLIILLTAPSTGGAVWHDTWREFDVDPLIAESVVWPEMERYTRLQDLAETAAVYGTYITTGGGPDYSIGLFQMKPSFIEDLEKAWMRSGLARKYELWFDTADNATARRIRITRLMKEEWQVIYVGVFMRLLYHTYGLDALPIEEQVRLAAAAYNRGCPWPAAGYGDLDRLRIAAADKTFHYKLIPTRRTRRYCYSTLAWKHYKRIFTQKGGVFQVQ